jgi:hypothetical protein
MKDATGIVSPDLEREIRSLARKLEQLLDAAKPLFVRTAVVRTVFMALVEGQPKDAVADVAFASGYLELQDALDALDAAVQAAAGLDDEGES